MREPGLRVTHPAFVRSDQPPLTVPATSILSRSDGIVPCRASLLPPGANCENIDDR